MRGRSLLAFSVLIIGALSVWAQELAPHQLNPSAVPANQTGDQVFRQRTIGTAGAIDSTRSVTPGLLRPARRFRGPEGALRRDELAPVPAKGGSAGDLEWLASSSVGQTFYDIAYELANYEDIKGATVAQAIVFLTAAMRLDDGTEVPKRSNSHLGGAPNDVRSLLIKLACRDPQLDYSSLVYNLLVDYVDEFADLAITRRAVTYLLEQRKSREEREGLLHEMLRTLGSKNVVLGSELATSLGLLMAEKEDFETAKSYLMQAYNDNRYNRLAFAKLIELMPDQIGPAIYLEHLRLALREDPSDIEAAIAFAQCAEQLQLYETAEAAYAYCVDLFTYLYPSEPLPARIYLAWAISSYNMQDSRSAGSQGSRPTGSRRSHSKCLQIAERLRQDGRFDLRIEALAAKAAAKIGDGELATRIFQAAEERARQLSLQRMMLREAGSIPRDESRSEQVSATQFAWFYCFALPDPERALYWANEVYVAEPNSATAAAVLSYALVMNNQLKWAKPLVNTPHQNDVSRGSFGAGQIADLALALIQLAEGQKDLAVETLKSVIAKDPGSLAAERAKDILAQQGEKYTPPVDPGVLLTVLKNTFGQTLVPAFVPVEKMLSVQFEIRGNTFPYGSEIDGDVVIMNNTPEPLIISDYGLLKGNIRIDADISGDLNKKVPNLVSAKNRTAFLVEPGGNSVTSLRLVTGELRKMLLTYPQASLDIEFTLYLDPVTTQDGEIANRLTYLKPAKVRVNRPGIELTSEYLANRFRSISEGQLDQKINAAQLFIGLLAEQNAMSNRELPYEFRYADWMPDLLRSALLHESGLLRNPGRGQWVVKVHTMAEMNSLPLDHELMNAVAENLNDANWPVRMMAIYLLARNSATEFSNVLDWVAQHDSSRFVRSMAIALGGAASQKYGQP